MMDSTLVDFLNSILPGLGVFISIIVAAGGTIFALYRKFKKRVDQHDETIRNEINKAYEDSEFKEQMLGLVKDVRSMKSDMASLRTEINLVSSSVDKIKETSDNKDDSIMKILDKYDEEHSTINDKIDGVHNNIMMMIESDKESIRSFITLQYYDSINKGYIELYVMENVETRYERYLKENGDSFVANLMTELRKLPHYPPKKKTTRKVKPKIEDNQS